MTEEWQLQRGTGSRVIRTLGGCVDNTPPYDARSGTHLWTVAAMYQVNPDRLDHDTPIILDAENLVVLAGIGCWYCEQPWSPHMRHRRCPGESGA